MIERSISVSRLAEMINAKVLAGGERLITNIGTIESAKEGDVCFFANKSLHKYLPMTLATAVIIEAQYIDDIPSCATALVVDKPILAYIKVAHYLYPKAPSNLIHHSAVIDASVKLGEQVSIGAKVVIDSKAVIADKVVIEPGCYIGQNVRIGEGSAIHPNVTLYQDTEIGKNVIIKAGAVIGADGFGFTQEEGRWIRIPQIGHVILEDDVEIGANTTVDRGAISATVVSAGVKIDNQVQVAHNVTIGKHTGIAGCAGISGSVKIGAHCMIAGGVGIAGHLSIADNVFISGMSLVTNSIKQSGSYSGAVPLQDSRAWRKSSVRFKQLDELARRIKKLEKKSE